MPLIGERRPGRVPRVQLKNYGYQLPAKYRSNAVQPALRGKNPLQSPAVHGKKRCRMHGGAVGSGAPRGNQNALKRGLFTREAIDERRQAQALIRQSRKLLTELK
jgi:hypothetical protein